LTSRRWLRPKTYRLEGFPFETYACAEALPSNGYIASAAGDAAAAGSAAASPANSGAASGGYGTSGGSKRRRVASAFGGGGGTSGATSRLAARPGSAGPSRLANVSAFGGGEAGGGGGGDTAVHSAANAAGVAAPGAAAVPSTGRALGAAAAAAPLPPRGPAAAAALGGGGCGAMLPSPGAAQSADDEDIDIDVGCEGPPGVNGSPLKAGPLAAAVLTAPHGGGRLMPVAVAAGGAAAAADFGQPHVVAEWLGAESMKRHQVFILTHLHQDTLTSILRLEGVRRQRQSAPDQASCPVLYFCSEAATWHAMPSEQAPWRRVWSPSAVHRSSFAPAGTSAKGGLFLTAGTVVAGQRRWQNTA